MGMITHFVHTFEATYIKISIILWGKGLFFICELLLVSLQQKWFSKDCINFRTYNWLKTTALHCIFHVWKSTWEEIDFSDHWLTYLFWTFFTVDIIGAAHAPEDLHNICLSEPLALIMEFPTHEWVPQTYIYLNK